MSDYDVVVGHINTVPFHDPFHRDECVATRTQLLIFPEQDTPTVIVGQDMDQGATDSRIWHHRIIDLFIDSVNQDGWTETPNASALEEYLKGPGQPLLQAIHEGYFTEWNGHNIVGHLTEQAGAALEELHNGIDNLPHTTYTLWLAADYLYEADNLITAFMPDAEMAELVQYWEPEDESVILDEDVLSYFMRIRDEKRGE
jgi:hypothetical protein